MKRILAVILATLLLGTAALAASPEYLNPTGIYSGDDALYIADAGQNVIFTQKDGVLTIYAGKINTADIYGNPAGGYLDAEVLTAQLDSPWDVVKLPEGYAFSDSGNNAVRLIADGKVSTIAGGLAAGYKDDAGTAAQFSSPRGLAADAEGVLYIADSGNNCIRAIDKNGKVTTLAGTTQEGSADGDALAASFNSPTGLCWYGGALYVADTGNHSIRKIQNGQVTTLAGQGGGVYEDSTEPAGGFADGWAEAALFRSPLDVLAYGDAVYVADSGNGAVRKLQNGWVSTCYSTSDGSIPVKPAGLAVSGGRLYISDSFTGTLADISLSDPAAAFTDVAADSWYKSYVSFAGENGLFKGVGAASFDPEGTMQRSMIAAVVARTAQISNRDIIIYGETAFNDVPADAYYAAQLSWAADKGIISGVGYGSFAPAAPATRQETVTMLYRLAGVLGLDTSKSAELSGFADVASVADWAQPAMRWAVASGIISGNEYKQLSPEAFVTRAQAAKLFAELAKQK